MKKVFKRQVQEFIFIWTSIAIVRLIIALIQGINEGQNVNVVFKSLMLTIFLYTVITIIWMVRAKKEYIGNNFLSSQIVFLDEDERGMLIHYKACEKAGNVTQAVAVIVGIICLLNATLTRNTNVSLTNVIYFIGVCYSIYSLAYLSYLKKLYCQ